MPTDGDGHFDLPSKILYFFLQHGTGSGQSSYFVSDEGNGHLLFVLPWRQDRTVPIGCWNKHSFDCWFAGECMVATCAKNASKAWNSSYFLPSCFQAYFFILTFFNCDLGWSIFLIVFRKEVDTKYWCTTECQDVLCFCFFNVNDFSNSTTNGTIIINLGLNKAL